MKILILASEAITADDLRSAVGADVATDAGIKATGDTGESEQLDALADSLREFPADRIVVFSHRAAGAAYREGVAVGEIEKRFGIPTTQYAIES